MEKTGLYIIFFLTIFFLQVLLGSIAQKTLEVLDTRGAALGKTMFVLKEIAGCSSYTKPVGSSHETRRKKLKIDVLNLLNDSDLINTPYQKLPLKKLDQNTLSFYIDTGRRKFFLIRLGMSKNAKKLRT